MEVRIENKIKLAIDDLYENNEYLFVNDLSEPCINHRFAICLDNQNFGDGFFVDCEYNRAYSKLNGGIGTKKVTTKNGNFIDIVITKRNSNQDDDLACFELKKWNNHNEQDFDKDRIKLKILTGMSLPVDIGSGESLKDENGFNYCFNYKYGIFIIFGENRNDVKIEFFEKNT